MPAPKPPEVRIGYHASHEQFAPSHLLNMVRLAEKAGFNSGLSSDHFRPWSSRQGESGYAWSWLGAAMQATSLHFGIVTAPGQRYHPAVEAQKVATLCEMFPGRLWVALGSGQLLNEGVTGERWPPKEERNERLLESFQIMRSMLNGETVTHYGSVWVQSGRLYTKPSMPPLIIGAALSPETAEWVGRWADGLITTARPKNALRKMIDAFREGGGKGKPLFLKVNLSYSDNEDKALEGAWDQWRTTIFPDKVSTELALPEQFDSASEFVTKEEMRKHVRISSDLREHIDWIKGDMDLGFSEIYLHNVNKDQESFIRSFGKKVLPALFD